MCGRYLFKIEEDAQLKDWLNQIPLQQQNQLSLKNVYPSQQTFVFTDTNTPTVMTWGIPKYQAKGRVINARIEGADTSLFFKDHLLQRRVIIRAEGFYEWDKDKHKHLVIQHNTLPLYMAGLFDEERNFAIITTEAQGHFTQLHHRIPLLLKEKDLNDYLHIGLGALNLENQHDSHHLRWQDTSPQMRLF